MKKFKCGTCGKVIPVLSWENKISCCGITELVKDAGRVRVSAPDISSMINETIGAKYGLRDPGGGPLPFDYDEEFGDES